MNFDGLFQSAITVPMAKNQAVCKLNYCTSTVIQCIVRKDSLLRKTYVAMHMVVRICLSLLLIASQPMWHAHFYNQSPSSLQYCTTGKCLFCEMNG